ncbi:MAG: protochlorophyllide oxidoreductase [Candidatus Tectomicrobia bacterium]|uniref:Protochlorophyllide oxidoreductase n=1 Tax=Tectimicrobiota bacterium TaxID=2528274 RepID=A0A938B3A3_UNCTE|nr:protochlorophyllide oxidoreductase [Candidatus Tectomicrobia bacterium]
MQWSAAAEQRLERAPSFVRAMVRRGVEELAHEKGYTEITEQVMDEARARMGM